MLLRKLLPLFLLPIGFSIGLIIIGLLRKRRGLIWAAVFVMWSCSTPLVGGALVRFVETGFERQAAQSMEQADAIVVLSQGRTIAPGVEAVSEWGDPDRFLGGVDLFRAGRAPVLIFTGGGSPWRPDDAPEGDLLMGFAEDLGIPVAQMAVTGLVQTTAQEATAVSDLLRERFPGGKHILLVTSAFHMKRSRDLFERAGLTVTPFAVDFQESRGGTWSILEILPTADALQRTQLALRELYGRGFYFLF